MITVWALHLFPCTGLKWKYIHLPICQCHYSLQTHQGIKFTSRLSEISQVHQELMSRFTLQLKTPSPNGWTTESNKGYCSKMVRPLSAAIYSVLGTKAHWVSHVFFGLQDHNEIFIYPLYTNVHAQTYISHVALIIEVSLAFKSPGSLIMYAPILSFCQVYFYTWKENNM